jgi:hypothetical protein
MDVRVSVLEAHFQYIQDPTNMSDKSFDLPFGFFLFSTLIFAFTCGINVGESLEKHRHCEALAKASAPTQAPACRD